MKKIISVCLIVLSIFSMLSITSTATNNCCDDYLMVTSLHSGDEVIIGIGERMVNGKQIQATNYLTTDLLIPSCASDNNIFIVKKFDDGSYSFKNKASGKYLNVLPNYVNYWYTTHGQMIPQDGGVYCDNTSDSKPYSKFYLIPRTTGEYYFCPKDLQVESNNNVSKYKYSCLTLIKWYEYGDCSERNVISLSPTHDVYGSLEYWEGLGYNQNYEAEFIFSFYKKDSHDLNTTIVSPTCTECGYTYTYCTKCNYSTNTNYIAALGHDWESIYTKSPTCRSEGWIYYSCSRCYDYYYKDIPELTCYCSVYKDTSYNAWYHNYVDFVSDRGIMGSTSSSEMTFEPNISCTRAMIATMLYNIAGKPTAYYQYAFSDVKNNQWYTKPIMWASSNEIIVGYGNGKFGTNDKVTREQIAVILKSFTENYLHIDTCDSSKLHFYDADKVSSWAISSCEWAVGSGLINGKKVNNYTYIAPKDNATRAEIATIMNQFINNIYSICR